jgi:hypothetical protein
MSACGCPIKVFIPGPPGPPLVSIGTFLVPITIDGGTVLAPVSRWQRIFIQAALGTVTQPVIQNPIDNGSWLLGLQVVGGHPIILNDASNLKLSGEWVANPDSILWLLWDGNSRWVEDSRNEI